MTLNCRQCGEPFEPLPGKPGYIDQCPKCLYEIVSVHMSKHGRKEVAEEKVSKLAKKFTKQFGENKARLLAGATLMVHEMTEQEFNAAVEEIRKAKSK